MKLNDYQLTNCIKGNINCIKENISYTKGTRN